MTDSNQLDFPFEEVLARATKLVEEGATVYQKFSCSNCGNRMAMDVPNKFYAEGSCDKCGHITSIRAAGCNYIIVIGG